MKIKDINHELLYQTDRLTITIDKKDRMKLIGMLEDVGSIDPGAEYEIIIRKQRKKRSLNANAYMWTLADKIADKTNLTKEDIYREAIRMVGAFIDVDVVDKASEKLVGGWSNNGIGWFAESFGRTSEGCTKVRLYCGSSIYDTKEMSRLIDYVVDEAKDLGIATETPDEIARMKSTWRA